MAVMKTSVAQTGDNQDNLVPARGGFLRLMGFTARQQVALDLAADFTIVDGETADSGTDVVFGAFPEGNGADTRWFGNDGIEISNGISLRIGLNEVAATIYYKVD